MSKLPKNLTDKSLAALIAAAFALVSASCGSSDSNFSPIGNGGGGLGGPSSPANFATYCAQRGGIVVTFPDVHCKIVRDYSAYFASYTFPYLTPSMPNGLNAQPPAGQAFYVRPGDRIIFQADDDSGWGSLNSTVKSYLGGFINVGSWSWDCDAVGFDGSGMSSHLGMPAGLLGSITGNSGSHVFLLGYGFNQAVTHEGYFRFGYNAPTQTTSGSYLNGYCHQGWINRFEIQHCESVSGATITCP